MGIKKFLGLLTGVLGVFSLVVFCFLIFQKYNPRQLSFDDYVAPSVQPENGVLSASRLEIRSLEINLAIIPATKNKNRWEMTDKGVSYLSSSPLPGDLGNSIMYGHNWVSILGKLGQIKIGDKIIVTMSDGSEREFVVTIIKNVTPDETSVLDQTEDKRITLYTCFGFLDSKRLVVVATRVI